MRDAFIANLEQQNRALERFNAVLVEEQAMLVEATAGADKLARVTERKAALAAELESLDAARRTLLASNGHADDLQAIEHCVAEFGCDALWQEVRLGIETARTQNEINGMAIDNRLDLTNRTLAFLKRATGQTLYGPNGRAQTYGPAQRLRSGV